MTKPGLPSHGARLLLCQHRPSLLPHQEKPDDSDKHKHEIAQGNDSLRVHRVAPFPKPPGRDGAPTLIVTQS